MIQFRYAELLLGGLIAATLSKVQLTFESQYRWSLTASIAWEYRPRFDGEETFVVRIPLVSGDLYGDIQAPTGTSSGSGDGDTVSLKGRSALWSVESRTQRHLSTPAIGAQ